MTDARIDLILSKIRPIRDFPKPGILFRDVTPLLADPRAFNAVLDLMAEQYDGVELDTIIGIESRGFIFGAALASRMRKAFVPVRKPGKLPAATYQVQYELEYGTDALEIHRDAIDRGERVLVVDDLIATGGTAWAAAELAQHHGGDVIGLCCLIELVALKGRERLAPLPVHALIQY